MNTTLRKQVLADVAPVTLAECVYVGNGTDKTILDLLNSGSGSASLKYNFALTGSTSFFVDFTTKTISVGTWVTHTNTGYYTTPVTTVTITEDVLASNERTAGDLFYFVSDNGNYKFVKSNAFASDNGGNLIFAIWGKTVYPLLYPIDAIKIKGGAMHKHPFKSIGLVGTIGDSITYTGCMSTFGKHLPYENFGVNGATVQTMCTQADQITSEFNAVIIMAGTNNEGGLVNSNGEFTSGLGVLSEKGVVKDKSTFYGAYQYIIETLYEKNVNMKIMLVCPPRAWRQFEPYDERVNLEKVGEAVKNVANFYSLPYVDLWHECPFNEFTRDIYLPDKLHPSEAGCELIGNLVKGKFIEAYCGGIF